MVKHSFLFKYQSSPLHSFCLFRYLFVILQCRQSFSIYTTPTVPLKKTIVQHFRHRWNKADARDSIQLLSTLPRSTNGQVTGFWKLFNLSKRCVLSYASQSAIILWLSVTWRNYEQRQSTLHGSTYTVVSVLMTIIWWSGKSIIDSQ